MCIRDSSSDTAKALLLECFQEIVGGIDVSYTAAHRWRYAFTRAPLEKTCLIDSKSRLGVCGDWCLGSRVEHGFLSGVALGKAMASCL